MRKSDSRKHSHYVRSVDIFKRDRDGHADGLTYELADDAEITKVQHTTTYRSFLLRSLRSTEICEKCSQIIRSKVSKCE